MQQQAITDPATCGATEMLIVRNDFLDAFADLESAVVRVLRSCGVPAKGEPLSHKLKAFRTAEKTPLIAKSNLSQRDQIADDIAALLPIRADVVHSRMQLCTIDGQTAAIFVNGQESGLLFPPARVLNLSDMRQLVAMTHRLVERIAGLKRINPASSPLPPSPDAAGGP